MKSVTLSLVSLLLLSFLASCGKNNESGKQSYAMGNPYYGPNGYGNAYTNINSPYGFGGATVNQIFQSHPCVNAGMQQGRIQTQFPLTGYQNVIPLNDIYAGVTSSGDVALLVGQGAGAPPLFVAYLCPRMNTTNGAGQLMDLALGTSSRCSFKPLIRATMVLPGSPTPLYFRWLDGGTSQGMPFPPPVCM